MHYFILVGGQQFGPVTFDQLRLHPPPADAMVWRQGLVSWVPLHRLPEFSGQSVNISHPPAPPPPPRAAIEVPAHGLRLYSWQELREIATRQRQLIIGLGLSGIAYVLGLPAIAASTIFVGSALGMPSDFIGLLDAVAEWSVILTLCGVQAFLAFRLAGSLHLTNAWSWGVGSCACCFGLILLLILNQKAIFALQRAGVSVGFFGTSLPEQPQV